jgi:hypothetical protein
MKKLLPRQRGKLGKAGKMKEDFEKSERDGKIGREAIDTENSILSGKGKERAIAP